MGVTNFRFAAKRFTELKLARTFEHTNQTPESVVLKVPQGDDHEVRLTIEDEDGLLFDLSNVELKMTVNFIAPVNKSSLNPLQIDILDQVTNKGRANVKIVPADTSGAAAGLYKYDIQMVDSDGKVSTLARSLYIVTEDVT